MINVIQVGLGPIGMQIARYITERKGIRIAGSVDINPELTGRSLKSICDFDVPDVSIYDSISSAAEHTEADVALLTTVSGIEQIEPQIAAIAEQKVDIVSTCEELTYPWNTQPEIANRIDEECKKQGISCLATGVNPGFLMDYLPAVLTSVCQQVEHISVARIQDATFRRGPFRKKIGVGLTTKEFEQKRAMIAHVGLRESAWMLAAAMGWTLENVEESLHPVLADEPIDVEGIAIAKGKVRGVEQVATGYRNRKEVISLTFRAAIDEAEPHDTIGVIGQPSFTSTIAGGVNGDIATAAITINAIRAIKKMDAGLKTMLNIPAPAYFNQ